MKTILIGPELEENLGVRYLAGTLLRAGQRCEILPFNGAAQLREVVRKIIRAKPDLVGLALVAQRRFGEVQRLIETLRRKGYRGHITAGGHFASLRAQEILRDTPGLDTILHHDAEQRILALTRWIESAPDREPPEELDGITWRTEDGFRHRTPVRVAPIDSLPWPSRRRPDRSLGYPMAPIVSSRGCAGSCSFCSIHAWHRQVPSRRLRFRAPALVADEMAALYRELGVRVFVFHDDDFIHPDERQALRRCQAILETAEAAIGAPIAFFIKARPDDVTEPLFRYLRSKGLARVYVGIETHSPAGIRALNRRVTPKQNERALAILQDLDVFACFNLLVFHPDSTAEDVEENLAFLERHLDVPFDVARTELYARAPLEDRMLREGRAFGDYRGFDYRIEDPVAEACFRLFADILWDRQFGDDSIVHRALDLRLRFSLLERFHPELATQGLGARTEALAFETNSDTVVYLRRLLGLVRRHEGMPPVEAVERLQTEMGGEIRARLRSQGVRWSALSFELEARAALGRSGLASLSLARSAPREISRLAGVVPGLALLLGSLSCSNPVGDPPAPSPSPSQPPQPCTESIVLQSGGTARAQAIVSLPFTTSVSGRLDVTVDWTFPSSEIGVYVVPANSCTPDQLHARACNFLIRSEPTTAKPRRVSAANVAPASYDLLIANFTERDESVAAQVVLSMGGCPPVATVGSHVEGAL